MLLLVWLAAPWAIRAEAPFTLGGEKHLFIDEFLVDRMEDAALTVNPPEREKLVMIADQPWERGGITSYGNVFYDPYARELRMYYVPVDLDSKPIYRICLATSQDGYKWEKPKLGAVEWRGSKENNIVIDGQREGTVMIDPNAPAERRYAIISTEPAAELRGRLFTSADGIHFTMHPEKITDYHSDSQISSFWDDELKKYLHFPRGHVSGPRPRAVARVETSRMDEAWPYKIADASGGSAPEMPIVMAGDDQDPPDLDLYTNAIEKYRLARRVYVGFPTPYYHYNPEYRKYLNAPTLAIGGKTNDGVIETQLATSRDSIHWKRWRQRYIPLHNHHDLQLKVIHIYPGLIYSDTHIAQYFAGYNFTHGDTQARRRLEGRQLGGVFRVEQRIDGFVSVDFAYGGGLVTTAPFTFAGDELRLNVNTTAAGELRAAILDADGKPIAPFTIENCQIVNGDYLAKPVAWAAGGDVAALAGKPIRLQFSARNTKLYAFQFVKRGESAPPGPAH